MSEEGYWFDLPQYFPGCPAVVVPFSLLAEIQKLEQEAVTQRFIIRAIVSDHIPLAGTLPEVLQRPNYHRLSIAGDPQPVYLEQGGYYVFYDLCRDDEDHLSAIQVEVEADHPFKAFPLARTAISQQLDIYMRYTWLPLVIARLDLFVKGQDVPIAHQLLLPFNDSMNIIPSGGHHQFPAFAAYESLIREAVGSTSPYYRFLCAYRIYEGINELRRTMKEVAQSVGLIPQLPRAPELDLQLFKRVGFPDTFLQGIKNANDLLGKFKEDRHRIAHFLLDDDPFPVHLSNGFVYRGYAIAGSLLLFYAQKTVMDLMVYFNREIYHHLRKGSILVEPEHREQFVIKAAQHFPKQEEL